MRFKVGDVVATTRAGDVYFDPPGPGERNLPEGSIGVVQDVDGGTMDIFFFVGGLAPGFDMFSSDDFFHIIPKQKETTPHT